MSGDNPFNKPQGGGFFSAKDANGHLIVFISVLREEMKPDNLKPGQLQRVLTCDIADLDDGHGGLVQRNIMVGNVGITNRLQVGQSNVLGRIGQLDTGNVNPAWVLNDYVEADLPRATAWYQAYAAGQIAQPAPQPATSVPLAGSQPVQAPQVPQAAPVAQAPAVDPAVAAAAAGLDPAALQQLLAGLGAQQVQQQQAPATPQY